MKEEDSSMIAKRLSMSLLAVGAVSLMVTAGSLALFSDVTTNQNNTFTAGTVKLGAPTAFTCTVHAGGLAPGDNGNCTVSVQYIGSLEAWLGVDWTVGGDLFTGAHPVSIDSVDNGAAPALPSVAGKYVIGKKNTNDTVTTRVNYSWSIDAGNEYQGKSGDINLKFYAVQARNNTNGTDTGPNAWQ
jgi:spore coat-associated protein N